MNFAKPQAIAIGLILVTISASTAGQTTGDRPSDEPAESPVTMPASHATEPTPNILDTDVWDKVQTADTGTSYEKPSSGVSVIALPILLLFVSLYILALVGWAFIFMRAGYSWALLFLMMVPIANLIWFLIFAFSKWPIQRELEAIRPPLPPPRP